MAITKVSKSGLLTSSSAKYSKFLANNPAYYPPFYSKTEFSSTSYYQFGNIDTSNNYLAYGGYFYTGSRREIGCVKVDANTGVVQWARGLYKGTQQIFGYNAFVDSNNNYWATGQSNDTNATRPGGILSKWDSTGTNQWHYQYVNVSGQDTNLRQIVQQADSIWVVGTTSLSTTPNASGMLLCVANSGTITSSYKIYHASDRTLLYYLAKDTGVNLIVGGYHDTGGQFGVICSITTTNSINWSRVLKYGATSNTCDLKGVATDSSNNVYACGTYSDGTNSLGWVAKWNSSGTLQWSRQISGGGNANTMVAYGITTDPSNNVYITLGSTGSTDYSYFMKYNSSGTLQWQRNIAATGSPYSSQYGIIATTSKLYSSGAVGARSDAAGSPTPFITQIGLDGLPSSASKTLNGYTYVLSASSLTDAAGNLTSNAYTLSSATLSVSSSSDTLSEGAMAYTNFTATL